MSNARSDITVHAYVFTRRGKGEFNAQAALKPSQDENVRVVSDIQKMFIFGGTVHPENEADSITLLGTNEHFYFGSAPYTLTTFTFLIKEIIGFASSQPENVYLILSSFPVLTHQSAVMNVTISVGCGQPPTIKLSTKRHVADNDPVYINLSRQPYDQFYNVGHLPKNNIDHQKKIVYVPEHKLPWISIEGINFNFSFNTRHTFKTKENMEFSIFLETCLDHANRSAYTNFDEELEWLAMGSALGCGYDPLPPRYIHIVVSNTINLFSYNFIGAPPLHIDPDYSFRDGCKAMIPQRLLPPVPAQFGPPISIIQLAPLICDDLFSNVHCAYLSVLNQRMNFENIATCINRLANDLKIVSGHYSHPEVLEKQKTAAGYLAFFSKAIRRKDSILQEDWFRNKQNIENMIAWSQNNHFNLFNASADLGQAMQEKNLIKPTTGTTP